jgi:hypothetical protein
LVERVAASAEGLFFGGMGSGKQGFHNPMGFHVQAIFGMDRFHGRQRMMVFTPVSQQGNDTLNVGIQVQQ